ncbi:REP-associated tyrosine transposase [Massilia polaris]|uniref:REP-associated tyrosine transposase n=1 Tax=Massilia polaris TaxID=2728846 RepID=UPI00197DEF73
MHCVWTLPAEDADYSKRWKTIKIHFSKSLPNVEPLTPVRKKRGERGIWQRRYWEHTIRDERDFEAHVNYVHLNPVKHGLVLRACD